jgi:hypothetical protein
MPTSEENSPPHTEADYYGFFMTSLFGIIDDAEMSGYNPEATELLRQAREIFWREFTERHPGHWDRPTPEV